MDYTSFETTFRTGDFSDNRRRLLDWKNENKTIQLGLKMFVGLFDAEYALIMAASVVSILPVGIVFLAMQKYFVEGIATSGMKN